MESEGIETEARVKQRPSELNIIRCPNNLNFMFQKSNFKTRNFAEIIRG